VLGGDVMAIPVLYPFVQVTVHSPWIKKPSGTDSGLTGYLFSSFLTGSNIKANLSSISLAKGYTDTYFGWSKVKFFSTYIAVSINSPI
jgi:hypothetical protein